MNVKIQSMKFNADKKLIDFLNQRLEKMPRYYEGILGAEVFLRVENVQEVENKIVEIRLEIPGYDAFATKQAKSFEEATDLCIDALKKQVSKYKEKQRGV